VYYSPKIRLERLIYRGIREAANASRSIEERERALRVADLRTSLRDRAVYIDAFLAAKGALSVDGMFPEAGPETARRALASIDPEIAAAKMDLAAVYTNEFVKKANAKFAKA
jgi:hypothetical protein